MNTAMHPRPEKQRLRILYFAPRECWPPDTGGKMRNYHLPKELARDHQVTYLGFAEDQLSEHGQSNFPRLQELGVQVVHVPIKKTYTLAKIVRGLLGRMPLTTLNYTTRSMAQALTRLLQEQTFDVIQVEGLILALYLPILRTARNHAGQQPLLICDWHNVDSEVMQRYGQQTHNVARRWYAYRTARQLAALERRMINEFDAHITVNDRDRDQALQLQPTVPVLTIESGMDFQTGQTESQTPQVRHRILFVGSMDYHANIDAVLYFAAEIWPRLAAARPDLIFTVVGRRPPSEVQALAQLPRVEITGTVADVSPYYLDAEAAIVPLRIGGGSRLKILEAWAAGVPVVSTVLGAEGLPITEGENILLADSSDEFYHALLKVIGNESLRAKFAQSGRAIVQAQYDWTAIGKLLQQTYWHLIQQKRVVSAQPKATYKNMASIASTEASTDSFGGD